MKYLFLLLFTNFVAFAGDSYLVCEKLVDNEKLDFESSYTNFKDPVELEITNDTLKHSVNILLKVHGSEKMIYKVTTNKTTSNEIKKRIIITDYDYYDPVVVSHAWSHDGKSEVVSCFLSD